MNVSQPTALYIPKTTCPAIKKEKTGEFCFTHFQ